MFDYIRAGSAVALLSSTSHQGGQSIAISGGLEVWVKIVHPGNIFEYLSGPLSTPVDYTDVEELWLGIGSLIANGACTQVSYDIMANGNLVYELL
jgi:hypothetical protein